ncbi:hypothetical protein [Aeromonas phage phiA014L]|uniref:Uncharacterized protein n=1 Tax=Aeromonas phage phiA014L TaxID=3119844 RepID=A0ABZ2CS30_9CAUD
MRQELSWLPSLSCGAALRGAMSHVLDYAIVNAVAGSDFPNILESFCKGQITLLDAESGDPADGVWLGVGVPDPRIICYKAASEYRLSKNLNAKNELISFYTSITNKVELLPGFVAPVATTQSVVESKNGQSA